MRRRDVCVALSNGDVLTFDVKRCQPRANPDTGILARFHGARWASLTNGRRGKQRAWNPDLARYNGASGVYVLRDRTSREVLYVGESHTGRLYRTLLHHFHDPKGRFEALSEWVHRAPERLEVLVFETSASEALEAEQEAIAHYEPRINKAEAEISEDDIPF